jgi:alpha-mannosidase
LAFPPLFALALSLALALTACRLTSRRSPVVRFSAASTPITVPPMLVLAAPLPPNVHLLTFQSILTTDSLSRNIVRLAHLFEAGEHPTLSLNATVDLGAAFRGTRVLQNCTETTLPGALPLAAAERNDFRFVSADGGAPQTLRLPAAQEELAAGSPVPGAAVSLPVTLGPMQVRTFLCDFAAAAERR